MTGVQPDLAARVAATKERLEVDAETWNPVKQAEHPREIAGLVVVRRTLPGAGHNGKDAEQMVLQEPDGHCWRFRLYGQVLQNELAGVAAGDVVAIRYDGWVSKPGRNEDGRANGYHNWSVTSDDGRRGVQPSPAAAAEPVAERPPVEPEPEPAPAVEPPAAVAPGTKCDACGMLSPYHARGCPLDEDGIPF